MSDTIAPLCVAIISFTLLVGLTILAKKDEDAKTKEQKFAESQRKTILLYVR